jgi:hypothetical protein
LISGSLRSHGRIAWRGTGHSGDTSMVRHRCSARFAPSALAPLGWQARRPPWGAPSLRSVGPQVDQGQASRRGPPGRQGRSLRSRPSGRAPLPLTPLGTVGSPELRPTRQPAGQALRMPHGAWVCTHDSGSPRPLGWPRFASGQRGVKGRIGPCSRWTPNGFSWGLTVIRRPLTLRRSPTAHPWNGHRLRGPTGALGQRSHRLLRFQRRRRTGRRASARSRLQAAGVAGSTTRVDRRSTTARRSPPTVVLTT